MNLIHRLAALSLAMIPVACATSVGQRVPFPSQSVEVTSANVARIYVVRDDSAILQNRQLRVLESDLEIGELSRDTYLCWERSGGRTVGRVYYESLDPSRGQLDGIADFDCPAGRAYYFNVTVAREDGRPVIEAIDPARGKELVAKRKPAAKE